MLTPVFELSQDETFVIVIIKIPFAKVSDTDIYFEDHDFRFYSKPYYLRLNLPGKVLEDTKGEAEYNADSNSFTIRMQKAHPGEHFEGLDMLTKLLAPRETNFKTPIIEVIENKDSIENQLHNSEDEEEFDWYYEQILPDDSLINLKAKYGFANLYTGIFSGLRDEMNEIIDLKNPDSKSFEERHCERVEKEKDDFNEDHYLADYISPDSIIDILKYEAPWQILHHKLNKDKNLSKGELVHLSEEEKHIMRSLPNKEYLLKSPDLHIVGLGLVDLIYCYAYQHRTTEAETNVESGWTICKLSPSLSWLEVHSNLRDTVISCMRRVLCYPLFRNWELAVAVLKDTEIIFSLGRKYLLKCLLEMRCILQGTEGHYILNDLFVTDYCIWIQKASKKLLKSLRESLLQLTIEKQDLELDLDELEIAARLVEEEEIQNKNPKPTINENTVSSKDLILEDSDDDSETEEETDDDSDSEVETEEESDQNEIENEIRHIQNLQNGLEDLSLNEKILN